MAGQSVAFEPVKSTYLPGVPHHCGAHVRYLAAACVDATIHFAAEQRRSRSPIKFEGPGSWYFGERLRFVALTKFRHTNSRPLDDCHTACKRNALVVLLLIASALLLLSGDHKAIAQPYS